MFRYNGRTAPFGEENLSKSRNYKDYQDTAMLSVLLEKANLSYKHMKRFAWSVFKLQFSERTTDFESSTGVIITVRMRQSFDVHRRPSFLSQCLRFCSISFNLMRRWPKYPRRIFARHQLLVHMWLFSPQTKHWKQLPTTCFITGFITDDSVAQILI